MATVLAATDTPTCFSIVRQFAWRVVSLRSRIKQAEKELRRGHEARIVEADYDNLTRFEDLLEDVATWVQEQTGIDRAVIIRAGTEDAAGQPELLKALEQFSRLDDKGFTAHLWSLLVQDHAEELRELKIQAGAGNPKNEPPRQRITSGEAEAVVCELAQKNVSLLSGGIRGLAKAIAKATGKSCCSATARKTFVWQNSGRQRKKGAAPTAVTLSKKGEAIIGEGDEHDVLNKLILQQDGQAISAVMASGMKNEEKAATIAQVKDGTMTPQQAVKVAEMHPRRPKSARRIPPRRV